MYRWILWRILPWELEGITSPCCLLIGQYTHHMTPCPPVAIVKGCYGIRLLHWTHGWADNCVHVTTEKSQGMSGSESQQHQLVRDSILIGCLDFAMLFWARFSPHTFVDGLSPLVCWPTSLFSVGSSQSLVLFLCYNTQTTTHTHAHTHTTHTTHTHHTYHTHTHTHTNTTHHTHKHTTYTHNTHTT